MTTMQDVNAALMGSGGRSAKFEKHGDQVWGTVVHSELRQQVDFDTNKPLFWDDGNAKMQVVITLATDLQEDGEDDGLRRVYVKIPSQLSKAMSTAVTKAEAKGIEEGGKFLVRFVSTAEPTKKGASGQKQYFCKYEKPTRTTVLPEDRTEADVPEVNYDDLPF